jgi:hypothetical protein
VAFLAANAGEERAKIVERIVRAEGMDFTAVCGNIALINMTVDLCHGKAQTNGSPWQLS